MECERLANSGDDGQAEFDIACAHDRAGQEAAAIPHYRRAIALGLESPGDMASAYLGLGSSLRVLGRHEDALQTFSDGLKRFPGHRAMQVFMAMACYNFGNHEKAMRLLLDVIASPETDATISAYRPAIAFYADKLDQIWPA